MSAAPPDLVALAEVNDAADFAALSGATAGNLADLARYRALLTDWNERMNLVGASTLEAFWSRHAWDCAQLLRAAPQAMTWADLGAGAGLPGIILAIMGKGRTGFHVHLVESMAKRCRFLNEVVEALGLPATVHNARAETLDLTVDVVTARACAPLDRLLGYAWPYFRQGAEGLFLKGQDIASEINEATRSWVFASELQPSLSDPRGHLLHVRNLRRAR